MRTQLQCLMRVCAVATFQAVEASVRCDFWSTPNNYYNWRPGVSYALKTDGRMTDGCGLESVGSQLYTTLQATNLSMVHTSISLINV